MGPFEQGRNIFFNLVPRRPVNWTAEMLCYYIQPIMKGDRSVRSFDGMYSGLRGSADGWPKDKSRKVSLG